MSWCCCAIGVQDGIMQTGAALQRHVFEYLLQSPACTQTRESIDKFLERCEEFKLSTAEKLNIINLRPSNQPEIYAIVEECGKRLVKGDIDEVPKLLEVVNEVLPQPPPKPEEAAEQ